MSADTATARIKEILQKRYPCQQLPGGAQTDIAAEVGCSRELVRRVAKGLGLASEGHRLTGKLYECANCKAAFYRVSSRAPKTPYCSAKCRTEYEALTLTCTQCGKVFVLTGIRRSTYLQSVRIGATTTPFCSIQCAGKSWKGVPRAKAGERRKRTVE